MLAKVTHLEKLDGFKACLLLDCAYFQKSSSEGSRTVMDLLAWSASLKRRMRKALKGATAAFRLNAEHSLATASNQLKTNLVSTIAQIGVAIVVWYFSDFLEPGSALSFVALAVVIFFYFFIRRKKYVWATVALLTLFSIIPGVLLTASYYIASDQAHLRYRIVEGTSYFEFPIKTPLLKSTVARHAENRLIEVIQCGDVKVAKLPLLPYKKLFPQKNLFDSPVAFRRFPKLNFDGIDLIAQATTGPTTLPGGKPGRSYGLSFGFSRGSSETITRIFPRSFGCIEHDVPLLPILEVLPWDANDTASLIKTTVRVDQFRKVYSEGAVSVDSLMKMMSPNDDNQYESLTNFLVHSVAYEALSGNVFAETRGDLANEACIIAQKRKNAFAGPFSALPENLLWHLVSEFGTNYELAAPACRVPDDVLTGYLQQAFKRNRSPFIDTFENCIKTAAAIAQCLSKDDAPQVETNDDSLPIRHRLPDEALFQIYDEKFSEVVVKPDNSLMEIKTVDPHECPLLHDDEEEKQYVRWWLSKVDEFSQEPAQCSSPAWRNKLELAQEERRGALACASQYHLYDGESQQSGPQMIDLIFDVKCSGMYDVDQTALLNQIAEFIDDLPAVVEMLGGYAQLTNDHRLYRLLDAFKALESAHQMACGTLDGKACLTEYAVWRDYPRLISNFMSAFGVTDLHGDKVEIVDALMKLDNVIINMGLCDLLQDKEVSEIVGYERTKYCDDHDLKMYRLLESESLGHSIERGDITGGEIGYMFESNGSRRMTFYRNSDWKVVMSVSGLGTLGLTPVPKTVTSPHGTYIPVVTRRGQ